MFAVVQHKEHVALRHVVDEALIVAHWRSDSRRQSFRYLGSVRDRGQIDQPTSVGVIWGDRGCHTQGQTRLPDSTHSGQSEQALVLEQRRKTRYLAGPPDQFGTHGRQVRRHDVDRSKRWERPVADLVHLLS